MTPEENKLKRSERSPRMNHLRHGVVMTSTAKWCVFLVMLVFVPMGCSDDEGESGNNSDCQPTATCSDTEIRRDSLCEGCRSVDDGCGTTLYCQADATCENACPAGKYQEYGDCTDDSCETRLAKKWCAAIRLCALLPQPARTVDIFWTHVR